MKYALTFLSKLTKPGISFLKSGSFFLTWVVGISIIFSNWLNPPILDHSVAWLRLYHEAVPFVVIVVVTVIFVQFTERGKARVTLTTSFWRDSFVGLILGLMWFGLAFLILETTHTVSLRGYHNFSVWYVWVIALFLNTVMQELLVRGYMFSLLRKRHNTVVAVIVTTLLFAAMHGSELGTYGISVLNVISTSILLSLLLVYTKGVWAPIVAHFIWNVIGGIVTSGIVLAEDYPSFYQLSFHGNNLMTGGSAKIEGSIVVLILNLLFISGLSLLLITRNKASQNYSSSKSPTTLEDKLR